MILALIALVITLLLVVGIHEAGHAMVARLFKVKIEHIAIGFGRPLLQWQSKGGVKWIWALWPLGGSVRLLNTRITQVAKKYHPQCFDKQSVGVRTLILIAGVLANLILAWLALLLVFVIGIYQQPPLLEQVKPDTLAYQAGLRSGDAIETMNRTKVVSWQQVGMLLIRGMGDSTLAIRAKSASGQQKNLKIDLTNWRIRPQDKSLLASLGMSADMNVKKQQVIANSFPDALVLATQSYLEMLVFFMVMLKKIVTGALPFTLLLGPVGVLEVTLLSFTQGVSVFAMFVAGLSLAVALINSLPIPGLDGGSIVYAWIEKIRGKPISVALEVLLYRLAVIIFVVLFVNLLANDIQRYLT
jgi:regulator of sigma E protease